MIVRVLTGLLRRMLDSVYIVDNDDFSLFATLNFISECTNYTSNFSPNITVPSRRILAPDRQRQLV